MTRIHDRITVPGLCLFIHETQGSLCLSQTELTVVRRGCHFLRMPGLPMFSFPSPQGTLTASSSTDAVVYLTAMALGIVLLAGAWKQPMHKTRWPAFCWMALLLTVTCLTYASMFVQAELVVSGYCLCGVVVCTVGMFRAFRKATRGVFWNCRETTVVVNWYRKRSLRLSKERFTKTAFHGGLRDERRVSAAAGCGQRC